MFRQKVEGIEKLSGLNLKADGPLQTIEDPTFEISRLNFLVSYVDGFVLFCLKITLEYTESQINALV